MINSIAELGNAIGLGSQMIIAAMQNPFYAQTLQKIRAGEIPANSKINNYFPPLIIAVLLGDTQMVKWLLDNGADVNEFFNLTGPPLHSAMITPKPNLEIIRLLIASGADVNSTNHLAITPIGLVFGKIFNSDNKDLGYQILDILLQAGVNPDQAQMQKGTIRAENMFKDHPVLGQFSTMLGSTFGAVVQSFPGNYIRLLYMAAESDDAKLAATLIKYGAIIDQRVTNIATANNSKNVLEVFRKANLLKEYQHNLKGLLLAKHSNFFEKIPHELFLDIAEKLRPKFLSLRDARRMVNRFLMFLPLTVLGKSNKNIIQATNMPPLHFAALTNQPDLIGSLVFAGADLEEKDEQGRTSFALASARAVIRLLNLGAKPSKIKNYTSEVEKYNPEIKKKYEHNLARKK